MRKIRIDRAVLCLAILYLLVAGLHRGWHRGYDFISVYAGSRSLLHGANPYDMSAIETQYALSGGSDPHFRPYGNWRQIEPPVYPPSTYVAIAPFGLLRLPLAKDAWLILNAGLFVAAVLYLVSLCSGPLNWAANLLAAFFLCSAKDLLSAGNLAILAVSALIFSCILYWRGRRPVLAGCLLCLSLAVKPQIGGLIALYLLLGKVQRRSVTLAISGAVAFLLVGAVALQLNSQSQHWVQDLRANIKDTTLPGHINDPKTPTGWMVNIQPVSLAISSDPAVSNVITYGALAAMLVGLGWAFLKIYPDVASNPLLFSAIAVFTLLPFYHRRVDSALLLLTLPSILFILERRRIFGFVVAAFTILASFPLEGPFNKWLLAHHPAVYESILNHNVLFLALLRQENLALLTLFWLYISAAYVLGSERQASSDSLNVFEMSGRSLRA